MLRAGVMLPHAAKVEACAGHMMTWDRPAMLSPPLSLEHPSSSGINPYTSAWPSMLHAIGMDKLAS